jgi:hypothetical protein
LKRFTVPSVTAPIAVDIDPVIESKPVLRLIDAQVAGMVPATI